MKCKINRNAAKMLKEMLAKEEAEGKMIRVNISHMHGDHAHYGISLDTPTEHDEIVKTDKDVDILLDTREEFLDGIWIQYFFVNNEGFVITNPSKGHSHHH
ncbi:heme biosynthesis protein HemY [Oceanobacillus profundus]|uniref:Iron-sulfur cluster assembly accessory protein n=1 Tax=Oceanobacillus profundus TaxID=372463 RepID=A0A417YD84_9BACI|nr:heme biosynthesis protein HemY [Oceanobacillus profundus]MBR3117810.1 iron-sulfur cluster assembly accessory protein [Oceanobacillus sp.]PAE28864.1 heme biosynthesis protein HemY [Paenibacillus sp. 7884-2]MCM3397455.1 iron-sulfur cluster assembly accessory protein [Oceanobacillus profundus]MDO6448661.1 iron-sulfur cluster assembly accessory protein [Oceanobacillus profundus]RHW30585.1 iron-sulfur cluster assembly accessory protein [Oceanobacillus profundus]